MKSFIYGVITGYDQSLAAKTVRGLFWVLSLGYYAIVQLRNFLFSTGLFKSRSLPKPVISVGNITWGGVGKTPCVLMLAEYLQAHGQKVGVLTRGYMASSSSTLGSDEAQMMLQEAPGVSVEVGADRYQSGQQLLSHQTMDVFILDDGFQHRRLKRDLDIVLIDCGQPFGNRALLPAGILREPMSSLCRSDVIILTKSDLNAKQTNALEQLCLQNFPGVLVAQAIHQPTRVARLGDTNQQELNALQGKSVIGICAIADPGNFERTLQNVGARVLKVHAYEDHYAYQRQDIQSIVQEAIALKADGIVTTSKDAVKLLAFQDEFKGIDCYILKMKMQFTKNRDEFYRRIHRVLGR